MIDATPAAALSAPQVLGKPDAAATDGAATTFFASPAGSVWRFYGTSEAAPHAAAIAALQLSENPTLTVDEIYAAQKSSAVPVGLEGSDAVGSGLLNALGAVTAGVPPTATIGAATGVGASTATITGIVNPEGHPANYRFDYGTSSAYGSSTAWGDAGAGIANVAVSAQLSGLTQNTTYHYRVVALHAGKVAAIGGDQTLTTQQRPANSVAPTAPPVISGTPKAGHTLTVSVGSWSGAPSAYSYRWKRDGVPIPDATAKSYTVQAGDQGHSITCTVTASDGTSTSSDSTAAVLVPIANARLCPKPTGQLNGMTLGPIRLGRTQAGARRMLPRFDVRSYHTDNFCLARGQGIRVGYGSAKLLGTTSRTKLANVNGKVVLALTANPYYTLSGVRQGPRITTAARRLKLGKRLHWGANDWYVIPGTTSNGVLKVRHGVVWEVGIANKQLTSNRAAQLRLLRNF